MCEQDLAIVEVITNPIYVCLLCRDQPLRVFFDSEDSSLGIGLGRTTRCFLEDRKRLQAVVVTFIPASFAVAVHNQKSETFLSYKLLKRLLDFA